ncbi:hypothetical protein PybrP1_011953 [[Pythium] brassicae (nom. inval.)]|nr:hypothetical protein PybrP1_011953 [[Pythium] brassicae (nom. inval.)]
MGASGSQHSRLQPHNHQWQPYIATAGTHTLAAPSTAPKRNLNAAQPHWRVGRRQRSHNQEPHGQGARAYPTPPAALDETKFRAEGSHARKYQQRDSPSDASWMEFMPPSPVIKEFGAVSTQNSRFRKYMEDECVAIPTYKAFQGDPVKSSFFGVYDGHGGDFCSKYAAAHLHAKLSALMESRFHSNRLRDSQLSNQSTSTTSSSIEYTDIDADVLSAEDIERCFAETFASVDKELEAFDESGTSGSTAVTCLIRSYNGRTMFHVANVGDSRAVFFSNGETSRLTVDHKATNEDEVKRIKALKGIILNKRVGGVVAVTRALGQADEKPFISSAPHTESVEVVCDDAFLVLVSDGVSDVFRDEELTQFVSERLAAGEKALAVCRQLLDRAKERGSMDNMTAVLVRFGAEDE